MRFITVCACILQSHDNVYEIFVKALHHNTYIIIYSIVLVFLLLKITAIISYFEGLKYRSLFFPLLYGD